MARTSRDSSPQCELEDDLVIPERSAFKNIENGRQKCNRMKEAAKGGKKTTMTITKKTCKINLRLSTRKSLECYKMTLKARVRAKLYQ